MVHIESQLNRPIAGIKLLEQAAAAALGHEEVTGELTVVLTDDTQLRKLNRTYLGIDTPTDVLSFSASETDPENGQTYLGDVLISMQRAEIQARQAGHTLESELQLLVVHGVLHLLGHDHDTPTAKKRMWSAQAEILGDISPGRIVIHGT
jgi:probable rRNA maturation factor